MGFCCFGLKRQRLADVKCDRSTGGTLPLTVHTERNFEMFFVRFGGGGLVACFSQPLYPPLPFPPMAHTSAPGATRKS